MLTVLILLVALRKESVDRNIGVGTTRDSLGVALRKESVDRNIMVDDPDLALPASLSARRAWIEIHRCIFVDVVPVRRSPQGERG